MEAKISICPSRVLDSSLYNKEARLNGRAAKQCYYGNQMDCASCVLHDEQEMLLCRSSEQGASAASWELCASAAPDPAELAQPGSMAVVAAEAWPSKSVMPRKEEQRGVDQIPPPM